MDNILNRKKCSKILLCKPGQKVLGGISGIRQETCNLKVSLTDFNEITFQVDKYIDNKGQLCKTSRYDNISQWMELLVTGVGYFIIESVEIVNDGFQETKTIIAHSYEYDFKYKYLKSFIINNGTPDSQEYLMYDENGNSINLNPYTNLPIDYISISNYYADYLAEIKQKLLPLDFDISEQGKVFNNSVKELLSDIVLKVPRILCHISYTYEKTLVIESYLTQINRDFYCYKGKTNFLNGIDTLILFYQKYGHQLSLLDLALAKVKMTGWKIGNVDKNLSQKKYAFNIDNQDIYSFLTQNIQVATKALFEFDSLFKVINLTPIDSFGSDTGICISFNNLQNNINITTSTDDIINTKFYVNNDVEIAFSNFGEKYIYNLDYFMNKVDASGNLQYVTKAIRDKWYAWVNSRANKREDYIKATKEWNRQLDVITELKNRVPNDGCAIDYKTFKSDELLQSLTAYKNALFSLIQLYKEDFNVSSFDEDTLMTIPASATNIKDTFYYNDFYSYKFVIIPKVLEALKYWAKTDQYGNFFYDDNGQYIILESGNPYFDTSDNPIKQIDSWLYEWDLYGYDELSAKKKAWGGAASLLYNEAFVLHDNNNNMVTDENDDPVYVKSWEEQSQIFKDEYLKKNTLASFQINLDKYLDYMSNDSSRYNSLTCTIGKGIIPQCSDAIMQRSAEINNAKERNENAAKERNKIAETVNINKIDFTNEELEIINRLMIECDYSNENIISTSLDDSISIVDKSIDLLNAATDELKISSQPQYSFQIDLDNLFALDKFAPFHNYFNVGNFMRVSLGFDENYYVKLRLISIEYNPVVLDENIQCEFSNMTYDKNKLSDLTYLFGSLLSGGSSSSSGGSSSGSIGTNDAEIQIGNNMLNALLRMGSFNSSITDAVLDSIKTNKGNFGSIVSNSAIFDSLAVGNVKVSGDCVNTGIIKSNVLDSSGNPYTTIDLNSGKFSFAEGKLQYDKDTLSIKGELNGVTGNFDSGKIGAFTLETDALHSGSDKSCAGIGLAGKKQAFWAGSSKDTSSTAPFHVDHTGALTASNANITGTINAIKGTFAGELKGATGNFNGSLSVGNDKFLVDDAGNCTANSFKSSNATITGGELKLRSSVIGGNIDIREYNKETSNLLLEYETTTDYGTITRCDLIATPNGICHHYSNLLDGNSEPSSTLESEYSGIYSGPGMQLSQKTGNYTSSNYNNSELSITTNGINFSWDKTGQPITSCIIDNAGINHTGVFNNTSSSGSDLKIDASGNMHRYVSSSKKYKKNISHIVNNDLNPHALYDIDVVQYDYKKGYLKNDQRSGSSFIGFLAEDVQKKYPIACDLNENGEAEMWNIHIMFPALLKLVQEQHNEIEEMKCLLNKINKGGLHESN